MNRCKWCGDPETQVVAGKPVYRCGTVGEKQSKFCRWQVAPDDAQKVRRPKAKKAPSPDRYPGKHDAIRDAVKVLGVAESTILSVRPAVATRSCENLRDLAGRMVFRSHPRGCEVSCLGRLDGIQVGESRLYSDKLRHAMTLIYKCFLDWQSFGVGPVYSFDLVDGLVWIRRVI